MAYGFDFENGLIKIYDDRRRGPIQSGAVSGLVFGVRRRNDGADFRRFGCYEQTGPILRSHGIMLGREWCDEIGFSCVETAL